MLFRSRLTNVYEAQANRFATDVLMPPNLLRQYVDDRKILEFDDALTSEMAEYFGVSEVALKFRLGL